MDAYPHPTTPRFLKTPDAAIHIGLSARTLEKHRCYGTGPVFRKLGGRIVYAIVDLDAWAELGTRRSTSDPGRGTVHPAKPFAGGVGFSPTRR
ncbi:MAG: DNA-binding protein [Pseudomonadota bacterium]|jgi:hypothetical protein